MTSALDASHQDFSASFEEEPQSRVCYSANFGIDRKVRSSFNIESLQIFWNNISKAVQTSQFPPQQTTGLHCLRFSLFALSIEKFQGSSGLRESEENNQGDTSNAIGIHIFCVHGTGSQKSSRTYITIL